MEQTTSLPPPARPLWDGIYNFTWKPETGKAYVGNLICLTLISIFAWGFYLLRFFMAELLPNQFEKTGYAMIGVRAAAQIFASLVVLTFLSSILPSASFMRIVQNTAAGDDRVTGDEGVWFDLLKDFFFLVWISFCSAALPAASLVAMNAVVPLPGAIAVLILIGGILIIFPIFLLSTLMANAPWALIHPRLIVRMLEQPGIMVALYGNTLLFAAPCLLVGYWMIVESNWYLAPLAGIFWATYWLTYARLLGRVGWVVTEDKRTLERNRRRGM